MYKDVPIDSTKKVLKSKSKSDLPSIKSIVHKFVEPDKGQSSEPTDNKKQTEITKPSVGAENDMIKIHSVKATNPFDDIPKDNTAPKSSSLIDDLSDLFNSNTSIEKTKQSETSLNPTKNDVFDTMLPAPPKKSYEDIKNDIMKMYAYRC